MQEIKYKKMLNIALSEMLNRAFLDIGLNSDDYEFDINEIHSNEIENKLIFNCKINVFDVSYPIKFALIKNSKNINVWHYCFNDKFYEIDKERGMNKSLLAHFAWEASYVK